MTNPWYQSKLTFFEPNNNSDFIAKIDQLIYTYTGFFFLKNFNSSVEAIANHLKTGIRNVNTYNLDETYFSYENKSLDLINSLSQIIKNLKIKEASILISGGKDSALITKILAINGVKVKAYHATKYWKEHPETKSKLKKLNTICEYLGVSELNVVYGGCSPQNFVKTYKGNLFPSSASTALANIFLETNISDSKCIFFSQGADTLSNVVHTQTKYFNDNHTCNTREIKLMLSRMYSLTFPKTHRVISLEIARRIINHTSLELSSLQFLERQNISRIFGTYLVHSPLDSIFFYRLAELNSIKIYNPFHTREIESLFMKKVKCTELIPNKFEINFALKFLGIANLPYDKSGFKSFYRSDLQNTIISQKLFRQQLYNTINGKLK
jgi:hypothetical protein